MQHVAMMERLSCCWRSRWLVQYKSLWRTPSIIRSTSYLIIIFYPIVAPTLGAQGSRLSPAKKTPENTDKPKYENKTKNNLKSEERYM